MRVPNAERAFIDSRKLTEYALNFEHDDGKHKAALFHDLLGLTREHADDLARILLQGMIEGEAAPGRVDQRGRRYSVDIEVAGVRGHVTLRSAWIIRTGEDFPRLVTCYIL